MGKVKNLRTGFFRSRQNSRALKKNGNGKNQSSSRKVLFEPIEPRLLLSADLTYAGTSAFDFTLRYDEPSHKLQLIDNATSTAVLDQDLGDTDAVNIHGSSETDRLTVDLSSPFAVPGGIVFDDSTSEDGDVLQIIPNEQAIGNNATAIFSSGIEDVRDGRPGATGETSDQVFYLDLDGEKNITYEGPVTVSGIDVDAFHANGQLQGQESDIAASLLALLEQSFAGTGIRFTTDKPAADGSYSTIYIGGDDSAFAEYGPLIGLSEKIDKGNQDHSDNAFIFADEIDMSGLSTAEFGTALAGYVAHEAGHLMGYEHAYQVERDNPLSAVAFKPYVHIEVAKDVRNDLLEDDKLTLDGQTYDINPRVLEAIKKYPSYFYAGSVGPDGFPELIMGGTVIHPDSTGIFVQHILDKAWEVQNSPDYSPEEKLQALAFAYGYPMHVAADTWSHTLVNEFSEGVWPDLKMAINYDAGKPNIIRHLLVEGYIADATPGFDGVKTVDDEAQRTLLPDGDVSTDSSWMRELEIPTRFVFDALIDDLPDLPSEVQRFLFSITPADAAAANPTTEFDPATAESWRTIFELKESQLQDEAGPTGFMDIKEITLAENSRMTIVEPGAIWQIKSEFYFYTIKAVKNDTGATVRYEVFSTYKSRGPVADFIIDVLRPNLVSLAEKVEELAGSPGNADIDPLAGLIDPLIEKMESMVRGDIAPDTDQLYDDLKSVASKITEDAKNFFSKIANQEDIGEYLEGFVTDFARSLGVDVASYLRYWIKNIDEMVRHWPDLGLAISRGLFDPQQKRDLGNESGESYGADLPSQTGTAEDPGLYNSLLVGSNRAGAEKVDIIDIMISEMEDKNRDGKTNDSLINQYILPMLGMPKKIGELRAAISDNMEDLEEKVLKPVDQLLGELNPIAPLIDFIKDKVKEYVKPMIYNAIRSGFGVDPYLLELLNNSPSSKMDIRSIQKVNFKDIEFLSGDISDSQYTVVTWTGHNCWPARRSRSRGSIRRAGRT